MTRAPLLQELHAAGADRRRAIAAAVEVMRSGRLHRYNTRRAKTVAGLATWSGICGLAGQAILPRGLRSGGHAMHIALRAAGMVPGEPVLTNAFTLAPVPGAIVAVGGEAGAGGITATW